MMRWWQRLIVSSIAVFPLAVITATDHVPDGIYFLWLLALAVLGALYERDMVRLGRWVRLQWRYRRLNRHIRRRLVAIRREIDRVNRQER